MNTRLILVHHMNEFWRNFSDIRFAEVKFPDFFQFRIKIPRLFPISRNSLVSKNSRSAGHPDFAMSLPGWRERYAIRWELYLTGAGESKEPFVCLLLCVMGKIVDLSAFDRSQIVMARKLPTSISETARPVGCSQSTVVNTYGQWMNDGETSSRRLRARN